MSVGSRLRGLFTLGRGVIGGLSEENAGPDPFALFARWFEEARSGRIFLPESMTLATATPDGRPSARMMLLKGVDERGFVFYTNYESRKALELAANPRAAIVLHWSALQRQVRAEGTVARLTEEESSAYFRTRPRGSRIEAWASLQSSILVSREELERSFREYEVTFRGGEVPLPPFWGGYRLTPESIEFWQGRANRMHDRLRYVREDGGWRRERLSP
ncbi:MAG: pyridoxamine 5'-phosphate oxidase [Gemmatimonadota bacterium]